MVWGGRAWCSPVERTTPARPRRCSGELRDQDSNLKFQGQNLASCQLLHPARGTSRNAAENVTTLQRGQYRRDLGANMCSCQPFRLVEPSRNSSPKDSHKAPSRVLLGNRRPRSPTTPVEQASRPTSDATAATTGPKSSATTTRVTASPNVSSASGLLVRRGTPRDGEAQSSLGPRPCPSRSCCPAEAEVATTSRADSSRRA